MSDLFKISSSKYYMYLVEAQTQFSSLTSEWQRTNDEPFLLSPRVCISNLPESGARLGNQMQTLMWGATTLAARLTICWLCFPFPLFLLVFFFLPPTTYVFLSVWAEAFSTYPPILLKMLGY